MQFTIDTTGDIVTCDQCGRQISAMYALSLLVDEWDRSMSKLQASQAQHTAELAKGVHLRAAQRVEKAWRSRTMAPVCPHCREPILATDGFGSINVSREIALRRRAVSATKAQDAAS